MIVNELTPEQESAIYRHLTRLNLSEFKDFFIDVLKHGDYAMGLMFVSALKEKVEINARREQLELQNMKLASITGGLLKISWRN